MKKAINYIFGILLLVICFICGLQFYNLRNQASPECIYLHDTIVLHKDSIVEKIKYITTFDTIVKLQYKDSVIYDTIYIPVEHKTSEFTLKKDSLLIINEKIHHSGYKTSIDSIEFNYQLKYSTPKVEKSKKFGIVWNVGPYAGYGINFNNGKYYFSPEVGVGVSIGIGGIIK